MFIFVLFFCLVPLCLCPHFFSFLYSSCFLLVSLLFFIVYALYFLFFWDLRQRAGTSRIRNKFQLHSRKNFLLQEITGERCFMFQKLARRTGKCFMSSSLMSVVFLLRFRPRVKFISFISPLTCRHQVPGHVYTKWA